MPERLKAFTLLELLVAMAVTGLVISIAGLAYNMLDKQFHAYRKTSEEVALVFQLNNRIITDFANASLIERTGEGLVMQRANKEPVQYLFTGKNVLRIEAGHRDTFHISIEEVTSLFKQEEQVLGTIDELYLDAIVLKDRERLHFTKLYSIDAELNREED